MSNTFYDRLLEHESRVIAMHCDDPESVLHQFRLSSRRSGRSVYFWTETGGLESLKASDIAAVPGTRPLVEALRYVVQSMHYGIYVLLGFERQLSSTPMNYLIQLATEPQPDERKVILISRDSKLPGPLARVSEIIEETASDDRRLRLRGGRWVLA